MERFREEIRTFANFPTLFMGLVGEDGELEHYDGKLRFVDAGGHIVAGLDPDAELSRRTSARSPHPWTYLKTSLTTSRWAIPTASTASGRWRA